MTRPTQGTLWRLHNFRVRDCHPLWFDFPKNSTSWQLVNSNVRALQPREGKPSRFGLFPFRSPLLRKSIFLSFPAVTEMFQFTAFASPYLCIQYDAVQESWDQRSFDNSPRLIAVFHALQSLLTPRHPPCALGSLTAIIKHSKNAIKSRTNHLANLPVRHE